MVRRPKKPRKRLKKGRPRPAARRADGRPLLSLAMMVRDEEDFLEEALASAKTLCDELIVVDTGSTDRTVEIAKAMGATVSHFEWCDDFSAARNETLRRATGQWILVLDADERLRGVDPRGLRRLLRPGPKYPYEAISLEVVNTRLDGTPMNSFHSVRVFPNDRRLGYRGRVHNAFGPLEDGAPRIATRIYGGLKVMHLGYDPTVYAARNKAARSLPLIEKTVAEEPGNHQQRFYLGREYLLLDRLEDARRELQLTVDGCLRDGTGPLVEAAVHLMRAMMRLDAPPVEVLAVGREVLQQRPDHPDLWLEVARGLSLADQRGPAADAAERVLRLLDRDQLDTQVEARHHRWQVHELLSSLYWEQQRYPEAYQHALATRKDKPADGPGWGRLLNNACALALELGDNARVGELLAHLLSRDDTPLGMFFFAVDQTARTSGPDAARHMLRAGAETCPRVLTDPEYAPRAARLGL